MDQRRFGRFVRSPTGPGRNRVRRARPRTPPNAFQRMKTVDRWQKVGERGRTQRAGGRPRTLPVRALFSRDPIKSPRLLRSPPWAFGALFESGKAANNGFDRHGGGTYRMPMVWKVRRKPGNPCQTSFFSHLLRDVLGQRKPENFHARASTARTRLRARFLRAVDGLLRASADHGRRRAFFGPVAPPPRRTTGRWKRTRRAP